MGRLLLAARCQLGLAIADSLRGRLQVAAASLSVLACACAPAAVVQPLPERRPLGAGLAPYEASSGLEAQAAAAPPSAGPTGILSLHEALALALERSPELAAFSWDVRTREAQALQAGLRPNPELGLEVENFGGSGETSSFDGSETTLALGQLLETAGKRSKRRRAADLNAAVAGWEYEAARLEVFAAVVQAFSAVSAAQQRVALSAQLIRVAELAADDVDRLVAAGATSPVERTRAGVAVATARIDREAALRALEAARARLAAIWGAREVTFTSVADDLPEASTPPVLVEMRDRLERNPELARWDQELERRTAVVELERAQRYPDVFASAGVRRLTESDDTALVAELGVPLPLFDRNQGAIAAAESDLRKAEHERRAVAARLTAELETAWQELDARYVELRELRSTVVPQAREAFEGVRRGYAQGLFRNVDVLDAQRTLFELQLREIEAVQAHHEARAELERLTGTPIEAEEKAR
jgi:cobalt-zinc-cadmium efflux system outer membrane protein